MGDGIVVVAPNFLHRRGYVSAFVCLLVGRIVQIVTNTLPELGFGPAST